MKIIIIHINNKYTYYLLIKYTKIKIYILTMEEFISIYVPVCVSQIFSVQLIVINLVRITSTLVVAIQSKMQLRQKPKK